MTLPSADACIEQYLKVRDAKSAMTDRHKGELAPLDEAMEIIENLLLLHMQNAGCDSLKSKEHGTAFKKNTLQVHVADKDSFLRHVIGTESWSMLDVRALKEGVQGFVEDHDGEPPPGVDVRTVTKIQLRRAS